MKKVFFLLGLFLSYFPVHAQIIYGANSYTQYHIGTLPIVISVPHGGLVAPTSIPDRTCNTHTIATDSRTIELSRQLDTAIFNLTGCHPHLIICNLKRTKIDCNRNKVDGTCGNSEAESATTSIETNDNPTISFEIIPNPATNFVQFTTNRIKSKYGIDKINVFGENVFSAQNKNKLDVSSLPKGIYFVQFTDEEKHTYIKKMMIQ